MGKPRNLDEIYAEQKKRRVIMKVLLKILGVIVAIIIVFYLIVLITGWL